MTSAETIYLTIVVAGMVIFALGLAYAAWVAPGEDRREG